MNVRTAVPAGILFIALFVATTPVDAGRHAAVSAPTTVDAAPPSVAILAPLGDEVLFGYQLTLFSWTVDETHPSLLDSDRSALIRTRGVAHVTAGFPAVNGRHDWLWTTSNISSGDCTLDITVRDAFGNATTVASGAFTILLAGTDVPGGVPAVSRLVGARPNPFNPSTSLVYGLAAPGHARLTLHDIRGRLVRTLVDQRMPAGTWQSEWNGRDDLGRPVAGGSYIARLVHKGRPVMTKKVVMLP